jgi:hypothetical protein
MEKEEIYIDNYRTSMEEYKRIGREYYREYYKELYLRQIEKFEKYYFSLLNKKTLPKKVKIL